jgi:hypothetical protein
MNWHLLGIVVFFFLFVADLADFVCSLRYADKRESGTSVAVFATILFLLLTWGEW